MKAVGLATEGRKPLFHFASSIQLASVEAAADLLRFLQLIDGVVFLENYSTYWIGHLNSLLGEVYPGNCRPKLNYHTVRHDGDYEAGLLRQSIESMRCASYTYYVNSRYKLPGVLEEISALQSDRRGRRRHFRVILELGNGFPMDIVERIDQVSSGWSSDPRG